MAELGRLITAMVTPFDTEMEIDYPQAQRLARALVASRSEGLVVTGTTGENPSLDHEENLRLWTAVKEAVGDTAQVVAGSGTNGTRETVRLAAMAEQAGVDAQLLVVPYYNKPTQEGLYRHFRAVAESTSLPCMLYNVPSRTIVNMTAETTLRLARDVDNVVGGEGGVRRPRPDRGDHPRRARRLPRVERQRQRHLRRRAARRLGRRERRVAPRRRADRAAHRARRRGRPRRRARRARAAAPDLDGPVPRVEPDAREALPEPRRLRRRQPPASPSSTSTRRQPPSSTTSSPATRSTSPSAQACSPLPLFPSPLNA